MAEEKGLQIDFLSKLLEVCGHYSLVVFVLSSLVSPILFWLVVFFGPDLSVLATVVRFGRHTNEFERHLSNAVVGRLCTKFWLVLDILHKSKHLQLAGR